MKMADLKPEHIGKTIRATGDDMAYAEPVFGKLTTLVIQHTAEGATVREAYLGEGSELYPGEELEIVPDGS